MSKFSHRKISTPRSFQKSSRAKNIKRRTHSDTSKHSDSQTNSHHCTADIKQSFALKHQENEPKNSKLVASKQEQSSSETLDREQANISEKKHRVSSGKKDRSKNIHSTAQTAEVEFLLEEGLRHYQQKEFSKCICVLEQAFDAEPENPKINYWLGMSYYQLKQIDKSLEYFVLASPTENCELGYVESFFWLGEIYRQQQKLSQSSDNYQKLLSLAPNSTYSSLALEHLTSIRFGSLFS